MKTLVTDAFDGEHPDDIEAEYQALIADYRAESQALNDRLFDAIIALYYKEPQAPQRQDRDKWLS